MIVYIACICNLLRISFLIVVDFFFLLSQTLLLMPSKSWC